MQRVGSWSTNSPGVRRANVTRRIGRLSSTQVVALERLVMVFLGPGRLTFLRGEVDDISFDRSPASRRACGDYPVL